MLSTTVQYVAENLQRYDIDMALAHEIMHDSQIFNLIDFMTDLVVPVMVRFVKTNTYQGVIIQEYDVTEYDYRPADTDPELVRERIEHHLRFDISNRGCFTPQILPDHILFKQKPTRRSSHHTILERCRGRTG